MRALFLESLGEETAPARSRISAFNNAVFVVFALVQVGDGLLTYLGISHLGRDIEGNPLIAWYAAVFGAGAALVGAKAFAVLCATVLHVNDRTQTIGALTIAYLVAAILPWAHVLWLH
jgi:hypothetical protein